MLYHYNGKVYMKLANGKIIEEEQIAPRLFTTEYILHFDNPSLLATLCSSENSLQSHDLHSS